MADCKMRHRPICKGMNVLVLIENALEDVLVVCLEYESRCFRGVLLDTKKRNIPHGVNLPWRPDEHEKGVKIPATGLTILGPSSSTGHEKEKSSQPEASALPLRHTYYQDLSKIDGKLSEIAKKTPTRHFKDKTVRNIRLRPRQTLCAKCKSACHEQNGTKSQSAGNFHSDVKSGNVSETLDTSYSSHTLRSRGRPMKPKPPRIELRKRPLIPVVDTFPRVKLQRLDSTKLLKPPVDKPSLLHAAISTSLAPSVTVPVLTSASTGTTVTAPSVSQLPKVSPVITISIGEGTVLKIPPRLHEIKESEGEAEEEDNVGTGPEVESDVPADLGKVELLDTVEDGVKPVLVNFPLKTAVDYDKTMYEKIEHKKRKKAMKKAKSKERHKVFEGGEHSENTHPERHHKHKRKHKHKHSSHEYSEKQRRVVVARSPLTSTSYGDDRQFTGGMEGNNSTCDQDDKDNGVEKDEDLLCDRPRLLYTWRQRDGLPTIEPKDRAESALQPNNNCDNERRESDWLNYASIQNSPADEHSNSGSSSVSYDRDEIGCASDINLNSDINMNSDHSDYEENEDSLPPNDDVSGDIETLGSLKPSLMMRIQTRRVMKCATSDGRTISVGDIIWGKIQGFPWWPGRILSITVKQKDSGVVITQMAHVSWFGSSTMSNMHCADLFPFLEDFNIRHNKKKRGPYKMAIKQATIASQNTMNIHQNLNFEEFEL